ncbi:hypothetical protein WH50_18990 [Pokkaliibacter plantistimulans]|uniref:Uncharacterized protein n=1 Tax=Pokkaliibacter plantistimulans TaxID=1635171 RepID=A0ABX5LSU1_9GAMM|nr:hypothetical protein [Pokkaliibacter plantistimulans]PXF29741.1 hypothetical protein WH50_18990 [Pokkaliibacter plantistimulans]
MTIKITPTTTVLPQEGSQPTSKGWQWGVSSPALDALRHLPVPRQQPAASALTQAQRQQLAPLLQRSVDWQGLPVAELLHDMPSLFSGGEAATSSGPRGEEQAPAATPAQRE